MEKKKTKKKWREIRSAVTMMCVMAAMLSTATYAWFTLTSSPTVSGMQMTAASEDGLVVSVDGSEWFNAISLTESSVVKQLKPVTPTASGFCPPVYQGSSVSGLDSALTLSPSADNGYVAVYEFWIKAKDNSAVNVGIIGGANTQTDLTVDANHNAAASGTLVVETLPQGQQAILNSGIGAVRMGLLPYSTGNQQDAFSTMQVIEPNYDYSFSGTTAPIAQGGPSTIATDFASDVKINQDGTIVDAANGVTTSGQVLAVPAGENGMKVALYIWLEGTDAQCADEIMADNLLAQIQFTVVEGQAQNP